VEQLGFEPLAGYLRGFIDLVFEYEGRTYVVDYKSTSISDKIASFTPKLVAERVATNHYALQTALYALVMHRYLRWRNPNYDYDRNFGGILLVFLRGVCPTEAPGHSVFFHRATETALDALDSVFAKAGDS
jgi:exodeoxyribonuclease V beta subunit